MVLAQAVFISATVGSTSKGDVLTFTATLCYCSVNFFGLLFQQYAVILSPDVNFIDSLYLLMCVHWILFLCIL
jgi:hypothetical protein